jgi:Tautomerase enzyme
MPIVFYDIVRGRSRDQIRVLLDSAQAASVEAFGTPDRDRYQLVTEHSADEMIIQDNGLGLDRSENIVFIHMINRRGMKTKAQKENLRGDARVTHPCISVPYAASGGNASGVRAP